MDSSLVNSENRFRQGLCIAGRYGLEACMGRGASAEVFRARDASTGSIVALKRLIAHREVERRVALRLKFRHEFHTLSTLEHPRIVRAFDYGLDESGRPFYTMELVEGRDLRDLSAVTSADGCRILRDVASALAFLHARRLIHRDLSPRNVRVGGGGVAKLIDFGALASVGVVTRTVLGTPPCIAPEVFRGRPLDPRTDLFALGAVAYWLFTGQHAYPATHIEDLPSLWSHHPVRLSVLRPDLPPVLDALVTALLSVEPLARPSSALEVAERLGAIAGLEPLDLPEVTQGHLRSQAIVGRKEELAMLARGLESALQRGTGACVTIEGVSGSGKSRLLRELEVEAKLSGALVLRVEEAGAEQVPYATARAIYLQAHAQAPGELARATRRHSAIIGRLIPELASQTENFRFEERIGDPHEDRARVQAALSGGLFELSRLLPFVLVVDDIQRVDEGSSAMLATLARQANAHSVFAVFALRSDETVRAPVPLAIIRESASTISLQDLKAHEVRDLVLGTFGEIPNALALARAVHQAVGGSPLACLELMRDLVDRLVIRCEGGVWVIPEDLGAMEVPKRLEDAIDARVRHLDVETRAVGQLMAVYGSAIDLGREVPFAVDALRLFSALDALVVADFVAADGQRYQFRHDGFREALVRSLDPTERRRIHLELGQALLASEDGSEERLGEIGWHLLYGGDESRGAELLARVGARLFDAGSFHDAIAPLEAALAIFEREGRPPSVILDLSFMLTRLGFLSRRELSERYADSTIAGLERYAGLTNARRLAPWVGRHLGVVAGLFLAGARHVLTPKEKRGPAPHIAFERSIIATTFTVGVASLASRYAWLERLVASLALFDGLWPGPLNHAYKLALLIRAIPLGRFGDVWRIGRRLLELLEKVDHERVEMKLAEGAVRTVLALADARDGNPACLAELERLEGIGYHVWDLSAKQIRSIYHLWRGEFEDARSILSELELMFVQMGSSWQMQAWVPAAQADAYAFLRDVLGLKRCLVSLEKALADGLSFEAQLAFARGCYHLARGEFDAARSSILETLNRFPVGEGVVRPACLVALADIPLGAGALDDALAAALVACDELSDPACVGWVPWLGARRVLALTLSARGDHRSARQTIELALGEAEKVDNPALRGALHEASARIALAASECADFAYHLERMAAAYWPTRNPTLIERWHLLDRAGDEHFNAGREPSRARG